MKKNEYDETYAMQMEREHQASIFQIKAFGKVLDEIFQAPADKIPAEHYNELTVNQDEDLHKVLESVEEGIDTLTQLKKAILTGMLSQQEAELWHDDLIKNAGMDFLSSLEQYAWSDQ